MSREAKMKRVASPEMYPFTLMTSVLLKEPLLTLIRRRRIERLIRTYTALNKEIPENKSYKI